MDRRRKGSDFCAAVIYLSGFVTMIFVSTLGRYSPPYRVLCEQSQGLLLVTTCRFKLPPSFSQSFYEFVI